MKPYFSIIIPSFNSQATIIETLTSVAAQSYLQFECIIVDDCSTDNSFSLISSFAGKDSRFILVKLTMNGTSTAKQK